ncbi:hypothetical protein JRG66_15195 [Salinimicrobium tongyeongense]|uniref:Uncharacterized protein n=1 Tax=Salinimicrobium tongyeongense TaxID=2809707 RepID=A0ABY6NRJ7_9FLAO|nr:hypothetical protein [Salinimicrobium tongyeongense]UZH55271.1 hypothetical protein JRG66_15195 [Salinimicrobium tongyeongense]
MLLERVNLQRKMELLRRKEMKEQQVLEEVRKILTREENSEEEILRRISEGHSEDNFENELEFDLLETNRIFHENQIKKICIDFRLRFLDTHYFKGELPAEAIKAVQEAEKKHQTSLKGFKMLAPAKYFRLENADDPMLFAPLGNGYHYLLHKWGTDMHPLRKLMMWPLKNLENLLIFCFLASFLLTFGIREIFFSQFRESSQFLILYMYSFKSTVALIFFYGISLGKNFSSGNWNSKFYNA